MKLGNWRKDQLFPFWKRFKKKYRVMQDKNYISYFDKEALRIRESMDVYN